MGGPVRAGISVGFACLGVQSKGSVPISDLRPLTAILVSLTASRGTRQHPPSVPIGCYDIPCSAMTQMSYHASRCYCMAFAGLRDSGMTLVSVLRRG